VSRHWSRIGAAQWQLRSMDVRDEYMAGLSAFGRRDVANDGQLCRARQTGGGQNRPFMTNAKHATERLNVI